MRFRILAGAALASLSLTGAAHGEAVGLSPLAIVGQAELPGYDGDFDHFAADPASGRLFLAAEDHGTLEVFRLGSLEHLKTVKGPIEAPHGVLYLPEVHKLLVTDHTKSLSHYFNSDSFAFEGPLMLTQGADSLGYDRARNRAYVVTGGKDVPMTESWLEQVDPRTGTLINHAHFDSAHVEAMAIEKAGTRLFINVSDKNVIAVLDKRTLKELVRWPVPATLGANCCVAFDEPGQRLFVVTRKPGNLLVLDARSGKTLATFKAPERVDQVEWDAKHHRAYAVGGEGWIQVIEETDRNHFVERPRLTTAPGAKTSVLVPERNELYVAVSPGDSGAMARVLRISTGN